MLLNLDFCWADHVPLVVLGVRGFLGWKETGKQIQEAVALHPSCAICKARMFAAAAGRDARVLAMGRCPLCSV